ncbi:MAG: hypothetical protein ONB44_00800 [candidate division KSB1 bacterium]|nr:hypothetical protein [candidate division KSB1 bacterium]MDZ7300657.1 hypothetical protein [candidate division KSB1 bacterium]MDZ7309794.1 hypothetical protein [candidate division KSB1 bacterium]
MISIVLLEIENMIDRLSRQEQLWLIEKLARRLREDSINNNPPGRVDFHSQLMMMANDPEVQAELRKIEQEFSVTEADGLERG